MSDRTGLHRKPERAVEDLDAIHGALVLARSGLHHSINYRSVVVMGRATEITDHAAKVSALDRLVEHTIPGRTSRVRAAHDVEVTGTTVLTLPLAECSMKVRSGGPVDDPDDLDDPAWAGLIPIDRLAPAGETT